MPLLLYSLFAPSEKDQFGNSVPQDNRIELLLTDMEWKKIWR